MMSRKIILLVIAASFTINEIHGRSIQDLKTQGDLPGVGVFKKRLNLSGKGISDLTGIRDIKGIGNIRILALEDNKLTNIPEEALAPAESLWSLNLAGNKLTSEGLKGIAGLKNLRALFLNSNNIDDIPLEILDQLPKLTFISLYKNPITGEKIAALKKRGLYISTLPITRANLKKLGLATGTLLALILTTVGLYVGAKKAKQAQIEKQEAADAVSAAMEKERQEFLKTTQELTQKSERATLNQYQQWASSVQKQLSIANLDELEALLTDARTQATEVSKLTHTQQTKINQIVTTVEKEISDAITLAEKLEQGLFEKYQLEPEQRAALFEFIEAGTDQFAMRKKMSKKQDELLRRHGRSEALETALYDVLTEIGFIKGWFTPGISLEERGRSLFGKYELTPEQTNQILDFLVFGGEKETTQNAFGERYTELKEQFDDGARHALNGAYREIRQFRAQGSPRKRK